VIPLKTENKSKDYKIYDGVKGVIAELLLEQGECVNDENIEKTKRDIIKLEEYYNDRESKSTVSLENGAKLVFFPCLWFNPLPKMEILRIGKYVPFEDRLGEENEETDDCD
jgi:hypothetical protein